MVNGVFRDAYDIPYMVNDVFRDAYAIPYVVNIVKLFRTMLTM